MTIAQANCTKEPLWDFDRLNMITNDRIFDASCIKPGSAGRWSANKIELINFNTKFTQNPNSFHSTLFLESLASQKSNTPFGEVLICASLTLEALNSKIIFSKLEQWTISNFEFWMDRSLALRLLMVNS